jgi:transposase
MPQPRRVLGEISGNIRKRKDLNPYERGQIIGASLCGLSVRAISKHLSIPRSTIQSTLSLDRSRNNGASQPRAGRPKLTSAQDERLLLRIVRRFPKYTYKQLLAFTGLKISESTVKRILRRYHITSWRTKKRPVLTKVIAKNRYSWCQPRRHWSVDKWRKYMWSDECSAERGRGKSIEWCFGMRVDKWKPQHITTYKAKKDISVMV